MDLEQGRRWSRHTHLVLQEKAARGLSPGSKVGSALTWLWGCVSKVSAWAAVFVKAPVPGSSHEESAAVDRPTQPWPSFPLTAMQVAPSG